MPTGSAAKRVFRRFDYTSIYLLIGGTFAPILLAHIGGVLQRSRRYALLRTVGRNRGGRGAGSRVWPRTLARAVVHALFPAWLERAGIHPGVLRPRPRAVMVYLHGRGRVHGGDDSFRKTAEI